MPGMREVSLTIDKYLNLRFYLYRMVKKKSFEFQVFVSAKLLFVSNFHSFMVILAFEPVSNQMLLSVHSH